MSVTPSQIDLLSQLLDSAQLRNRVISQNVANVNTPGYRALDVSFEEQLAKTLSSLGDAKALDTQPQVHEVSGLRVRADGNNVDIDREMGQLSKNTLFYQTYSQILASKLSTMRSAITGQ